MVSSTLCYTMLKTREIVPAQTTREKCEDSVFKTFPVHAKTQIPPVSRVFSKCSLFLTDLGACGVQGKP